ncbi:FMN-binding negative transcriptional regulator [Pseudohoeflea coraliihabitans]|uniref:FMN-binding negative transcriptional regulator n=1 Tax=Pseudohoeflea coraliihabitans TaxID=2860393 RepID=A0ABS6WS56_9HYPH|nr:FMN-binding negative transcriptional regulator [Pseudohoeflea sp. DP4N28-3]MBW3098799.1 FMN-binding negative transcriptional regulator [Pseudohoeflea sp. DP4N28-3]
MYVPSMFAEDRPEEIARLIAAYPLATLVAVVSGMPTAMHLPLLAAGSDRLIGHIALANDMHRTIAEDTPVLAVFRGEDSYVSPNWYLSKATDPRFVPTWNYQAVHVEGRIRFMHDVKFKRMVVGRLTRQFEKALNGEDAWRMADAPADYMDGMLDNIVGLEIAITSVAGKSKISQNRAPEDYDNVARQLEACGKADLAAAMRRTPRG